MDFRSAQLVSIDVRCTTLAFGFGWRVISNVYFLTCIGEKDDMTILYALVARGTVVLAEFSAASGNASTIARRILEKIPAGGDSRVSYSQDRHIFHIMKADGLTFLCMASDTFGSKMRRFCASEHFLTFRVSKFDPCLELLRGIEFVN